MSREVIATIKLAMGRVGFYDELSRIHLSIGAPTAHVYSGTNCARLRRAVRDGVINLVDGSLGGNVPPFKIVKVGDKLKLASNAEEEMKPVEKQAVKEESATGTKKEKVAEEKPAEPKEEPAKEEAVAEPEEKESDSVAETDAEENTEEKAKKKTTRGRSKKTQN